MIRGIKIKINLEKYTNAKSKSTPVQVKPNNKPTRKLWEPPMRDERKYIEVLLKKPIVTIINSCEAKPWLKNGVLGKPK